MCWSGAEALVAKPETSREATKVQDAGSRLQTMFLLAARYEGKRAETSVNSTETYLRYT